MNTNQFWNPITLASNIKKTPSYESLSTEDKLKRRLDRIETAVGDCNFIINNQDATFFNYITGIINIMLKWIFSKLKYSPFKDLNI